jgi:hypothetical protein
MTAIDLYNSAECVVLIMCMRSEFRVRYDFRIKRCSVRFYLQLFVEGPMSYLRHLCVFSYSCVQHIPFQNIAESLTLLITFPFIEID